MMEKILKEVQFKQEKLNPDLFSRIAQEAAKALAQNPASNKPTQLRRFYDEIMMWEQKVSNQSPEKFSQYLPFIRMINAKVAYAKGRKLVDDQYVLLMNHCLKQVQDIKSMQNFKLFIEAMMGFYKQERPRDN